jgi:hypothetical protein
MDLRYKELHCLLGLLSPLSVNNKLLLYKTVIIPLVLRHRIVGLCFQVKHTNNTAGSIKNVKIHIRRPMVCHQCHAAQASWYTTNSGRHPRQKHQAPSHTTIASKSPTAIPTTGTCHRKTTATVAN